MYMYVAIYMAECLSPLICAKYDSSSYIIMMQVQHVKNNVKLCEIEYQKTNYLSNCFNVKHFVLHEQADVHCIKHEVNIPFRVSDPEGGNFMLKFIQESELCK